MKLQRYNIARTTVSELQNSNLQSPEEAAKNQATKFAAITSGVLGLSEMATTIAGIRAETEYDNAITDLDDLLSDMDRDIDEMDLQKDELGNVVFDADKVIEMERTGRQAYIDLVRENIKSGTAKRAYDKHVTKLNMQRNEVAQAAYIKRERETLKANSELRRVKLINENRFDTAIFEAELDATRGIISAPELNAARLEITIARDNSQLADLSMNMGATQAELQLHADSLRAGKWDAKLGVDNPDMAIGDKERAVAANAIYRRIAGIDDLTTETKKEWQENNYRDIAKQIRNREENPATGEPWTHVDIYDLPADFVTGTRVNALITSLDSGDAYNDDQETKNRAEHMLFSIRNSKNMNASLDGYLDWVDSRDDLKPATKKQLADDADQLVNKIFNNPIYSAALDVEIAGLIDVTLEKQRYGGDVQDNREERMAAAEMTRDFYKAALKQGRDFDPEAWLANPKTGAIKYYKDALGATFAELGIFNPENYLDENHNLDRDKVFRLLEREFEANYPTANDERRDRWVTSRWKRVSGLIRRIQRD